MIALNKLNPEDIQEKIDLNAKDGVDIYKLKELIEEEKKDFEWVVLRGMVQVQCYKEQLDYINKKIQQMKAEEVLETLDKANIPGPEGSR